MKRIQEHNYIMAGQLGKYIMHRNSFYINQVSKEESPDSPTGPQKMPFSRDDYISAVEGSWSRGSSHNPVAPAIANQPRFPGGYAEGKCDKRRERESLAHYI